MSDGTPTPPRPYLRCVPPNRCGIAVQALLCPPLFNCRAALSALGEQRSAALFATGRGTRERRGITCPNHCGSATVSPNVRLVVIRSARAPLPLLFCQPAALRHGTQHLRQHFLGRPGFLGACHRDSRLVRGERRSGYMLRCRSRARTD